MKYIAPVAELVAVEAINVLLASVDGPTQDCPTKTQSSGCSDDE